MAEYISGSINFQGLGNGTDFGSIIEQLKRIESIPMQRMQIWKRDWDARARAFEVVLQSMRDARTALSSLNSRDKFVSKIANSSKREIAAVSATGKALDGTHSIDVSQLASNAVWSCLKDYDKKTSTVSTENTQFVYTYKGETRSLNIAANTSLESFVNMVNNDPQNKGIRASIVQSGSGYRLQIQGQDSGKDATLSITPTAGLNFLSEPAWQSSQTFATGDEVIWSGPGLGEFKYTIGHGNPPQTIDIDPDATFTVDGEVIRANTVNGLIFAINEKSGDGTARLENGKLVIEGATSVKGPASAGTIGTTYWNSSKAYELDEPFIPVDDPPQTFRVTIDSDDLEIEIKPGDTVQNVVDAINEAYLEAYRAKHPPDTPDPPDPPDVASLVQDSSGKYAIQIAGATSASGAGISGSSSQAVNGLNIEPVINIDPGSPDAIRVTPGSSMPGDFTFGGWVVQEPQNAIFKLDNWPDMLESTSNTISDVLEGVTITVYDVGKAQLSISTDTNSVQQNIQNVLDAINSVLLTIRELSDVDTSNSGYNFSVAGNQADSGSKAIGSVLTGNYGVQLLNSRLKSLAAGMPPGFQRIQGNDLFSGDLISAFSQIGIKTVSDTSDPNYGLFVIAPYSATAGMQDMDARAFDEALTKNLDALINFFACDDEGSSTSANFRYASHVKGGTKAGTYDVTYTVSYADGSDEPVIDVWIDGQKALRDVNMDGYWFTSANGPSAGLAIQIDNLNAGSHSGKVSIKQGKIRELEDFFIAETRGYDAANNTGGALEILKRNYANVMENIDKKIEREQARLVVWERTQKLAFARLDTLLGQYTAHATRLDAEIARLE